MTKDNLIKFPKKFEPVNYDNIPVNKVLNSADKESLDEVIVLGIKNGEVKIFSSQSDVKEIVYLCDYAKALIMKSVVGNLYLDIK